MLLNLALAETVPVLLVLGLVAATAPTPPWTVLLWGGCAMALVAPLVGYPFAKTLWLFLDMQFRPPIRTGPRG
jgi:hypothetical protein